VRIGKFDSIYRLILVSAERAGRLIDGETTRIPPRDSKPTYIALEEVMQDKIGVKFTSQEGKEVVIGPYPCESSSE